MLEKLRQNERLMQFMNSKQMDVAYRILVEICVAIVYGSFFMSLGIWLSASMLYDNPAQITQHTDAVLQYMEANSSIFNLIYIGMAICLSTSKLIISLLANRFLEVKT